MSKTARESTDGRRRLAFEAPIVNEDASGTGVERRTQFAAESDSNAQDAPPQTHSSELELAIRGALERRPLERSDEEVDLIWEHVVKPFKDSFVMQMQAEVQRAMCSRLILEDAKPGTVVMEFGEMGDKVYLIYRGKVQLDVPIERLQQAAASGMVGAAATAKAALAEAAAATPGKALDPSGLATLKNLEAGRVVGERSMIPPESRRNARVTAVEDSMLLSLSIQDYQYCLSCSTGNYVQERVAFLASLDRAGLAGLDEADLRTMATHLKEESHMGEQVILRQGAEVDRVVLVKSGFCRVVRELHPRLRPMFNQYSEKDGPPPNPLALDQEPEHEKPRGRKPSGSISAGPSFTSSRPSLRGSSVDSWDPNGASKNETFRQRLAKLLPSGHGGGGIGTDAGGPDGGQRGNGGSPTSGSAAAAARSRQEAKAGGCPIGSGSGGDIVHVDQLGAGRSFGTMEMFEGLPYQCSLVASPWAVVYVISKYDLIRNTPKTILHRLFTDYQVRLSDDRLVQRLKQKNRWNNYKRGLLDEIRGRKTRDKISAMDRRAPVPLPAGPGALSTDDYARIGNGDSLWHGRAKTPPKPAHTGKGGQDILHIRVVLGEDGHRDVELQRERRDASMIALDERIIMMTSNARMRDRNRRQGREVAAAAAPEEQQPAASAAAVEEADPASASSPTPEGRQPPVSTAAAGAGGSGGRGGGGGGGAAAASERRKTGPVGGTQQPAHQRQPPALPGRSSKRKVSFPSAAVATAALPPLWSSTGSEAATPKAAAGEASAAKSRGRSQLLENQKMSNSLKSARASVVRAGHPLPQLSAR